VHASSLAATSCWASSPGRRPVGRLERVVRVFACLPFRQRGVGQQVAACGTLARMNNGGGPRVPLAPRRRSA
jgi:hypothetical protein